MCKKYITYVKIVPTYLKLYTVIFLKQQLVGSNSAVKLNSSLTAYYIISLTSKSRTLQCMRIILCLVDVNLDIICPSIEYELESVTNFALKL